MRGSPRIMNATGPAEPMLVFGKMTWPEEKWHESGQSDSGNVRNVSISCVGDITA